MIPGFSSLLGRIQRPSDHADVFDPRLVQPFHHNSDRSPGHGGVGSQKNASAGRVKETRLDFRYQLVDIDRIALELESLFAID